MKSDIDLVIEAKSGDKLAFSQLVSRHQRLLLKVALRVVRDLETAEDIVQESFIKAYQKLNLFEGRSSFRTWLYQITLNTARNRFRRPDRVEDLISGDEEVSHLTGEQILLEVGLNKMIQAEIDKLPPKQKKALSMRVFDDLTFEEIAEIMHCPYDTAKANYRHGLLKLREIFSENSDFKSYLEPGGFFEARSYEARAIV